MDKVQKIVNALETKMNSYKAAAIQQGNWAKEKMAEGDTEGALDYMKQESAYLTQYQTMRSAYCIALSIQKEDE